MTYLGRRYKSDIPSGARERVDKNYKFGIRKECVFRGKVVGYRFYDQNGLIEIEEPLLEGKLNGVVYNWHDGVLVSAEPYKKGKPHGIAKQWDDHGRVIGTYKMMNGTGLDVWREGREDGTVYISEIHSIVNGLRHGWEWWFNEDGSIWIERYWQHGKLHGIEWEWNSKGRLCREFPKYYVDGEKVPKRLYIKISKADTSLPAFKEDDQIPRRRFSPEITSLLKNR